VNTIAINMYRRAAHANRRKQPLLDLFSGPSIDMAAIILKSVLKCCPSSDRALLLHQLNGLTTTEMARQIGITEGAIRIRLLRARRSARSMVEFRQPIRTAA